MNPVLTLQSTIGRLVLTLRSTAGHLVLTIHLKVHKIEIFFGFDFEICIISLLVR